MVDGSGGKRRRSRLNWLREREAETVWGRRAGWKTWVEIAPLFHTRDVSGGGSFGASEKREKGEGMIGIGLVPSVSDRDGRDLVG